MYQLPNLSVSYPAERVWRKSWSSRTSPIRSWSESKRSRIPAPLCFYKFGTEKGFSPRPWGPPLFSIGVFLKSKKKEFMLCRVSYRKLKSSIIRSRIAAAISARSLSRQRIYMPRSAWSCPCLTFRRAISSRPISQDLISRNGQRQPKGDWQ